MGISSSTEKPLGSTTASTGEMSVLITEGTLPAGETPVIITEGTLPPGEAPVLIIEETLPPGETPLLMTEGTLPPGETPILITEGTLPPVETPVVITEGTVPAGETPILITEGTLPPGETPVVITEGTVPAGETPILIMEGTLPPGEIPVLITEGTLPQGETTGLVTDGPHFETSSPTRQTPLKIGTKIEKPTDIVPTTDFKETTFLAIDIENGRDFEKTSPTTTTATEQPVTTNDCCAEYSHRGSPDCYEYCELAEQLAALMALLASYGRHRHRRSHAYEMEELIMDNLYTAYIDLEECIQFSECRAEKIQAVHAALSGISKASKTLGTLSREFLARVQEFNLARLAQVDRALAHSLSYNCSLLEKTAVMGEAVTTAACLAYKAEASPATAHHKKDVECDKEFAAAVGELMGCVDAEKTCSNKVVFKSMAALNEQGECVSIEEARKSVGIIENKISMALGKH